MGSFLGARFRPVDLSVFMPESCCFDDCSFGIRLKPGCPMPPALLYQDCYWHSGFLWFYTKFSIIFPFVSSISFINVQKFSIYGCFTSFVQFLGILSSAISLTIFIKFVAVTLVNKTILVSSVQFHNTSSVF